MQRPLWWGFYLKVNSYLITKRDPAATKHTHCLREDGAWDVSCWTSAEPLRQQKVAGFGHWEDTKLGQEGMARNRERLGAGSACALRTAVMGLKQGHHCPSDQLPGNTAWATGKLLPQPSPAQPSPPDHRAAPSQHHHVVPQLTGSRCSSSTLWHRTLHLHELYAEFADSDLWSRD